MASVCFYFQVHQPYRLRRYTIFDHDSNYFDEVKNTEICKKVANKCYLPTNLLLLELIEKHHGRFKVSFSVTGVLLEQLQSYAPKVFESFQRLASSGCVEFLAETYYHSLSFLYSHNEFVEQIDAQIQTVQRFFGQTPRIFRNTELIYNNTLAELIGKMNCFDAILAEGADHILGYRSPNFVYNPVNNKKLKLLLKNYRLSDDIAFRFSNRAWNQWPLQADKFASWINAVNGCGYTVNLFMDYETFGEHQWEDTGIFNFMRHLPDEILKHPHNDFKTPSEVVASYDAVGEIDVPYTVSWADIERDLSAWLGNQMQQNALRELYKMEAKVKSTEDKEIISDFRKMQTSDHFYYMCTKWFSDGDVHKYFNPYNTPYEAYINFMNVLDNLNSRCRKVLQQKEQKPQSIPINQALVNGNIQALSDSGELSRADKPTA
ncbi:MAG: alpha-amylase [Planctomycetes bacterium RBG_13_44_8b]|nr:MAG: alpha-amylase [Planctomycetes bacterium RBG_13_44_8b]